MLTCISDNKLIPHVRVSDHIVAVWWLGRIRKDVGACSMGAEGLSAWLDTGELSPGALGSGAWSLGLGTDIVAS